MGIVTLPYSFVAAQIITATQINANFDALYGELNGNIDDTNIKATANIDGAKLANSTITSTKLASAIITEAHMDYSSVHICRVGPNLPAYGARLAKGTKAFTYAAGTTSLVIVFSTDSDDGDPQYSSPPRVVPTIRMAANANLHSVILTVVAATAFAVELRSSNVADTSTGYVDWEAVGPV